MRPRERDFLELSRMEGFPTTKFLPIAFSALGTLRASRLSAPFPQMLGGARQTSRWYCWTPLKRTRSLPR